jgi:methylthioribose-1-phosphate isomerase
MTFTQIERRQIEERDKSLHDTSVESWNVVVAAYVWYHTRCEFFLPYLSVRDGDRMSENAQTQGFCTIRWEEDAGGAAIYLLDQSLLPQEVRYLRLTSAREVGAAIQGLKVRGAPAIGVSAAFGMAIGMYELLHERGETVSPDQARQHLSSIGAMLSRTRPTAVNLFWAIERIQQRAEQALQEPFTLLRLARCVRDEGLAITAEDAAACLQMGSYGAELIADGDALLTHCNAGALATAGLGTALAAMYVAHRAGKHFHVFVDETRPILQGARLTAWELQQEGIPLTLITDNMAGHFMRQGDITAVFVGADRIAANGDVANKIGTYSLAVLAHAHDIPFYVVAPSSSIDMNLPGGELIPIEQRHPGEVTTIGGSVIAPRGIQVANPAFDVTPHRYVHAIVTERGIVRPPFGEGLHRIFLKTQEIEAHK